MCDITASGIVGCDCGAGGFSGRGTGGGSGGDGPGGGFGRSGWPERHIEATLMFELRKGLSPDEKFRRMSLANRAGDVGARVLAWYLLDMYEVRDYQAFGYHNVLRFAEAKFGLRPQTTQEYLRVARALEELPLIDEALSQGQVLWSAVRDIVRVATPETEAAWLGATVGRTVREIAILVRRREKGQRPTDPARRRIHGASFQIQAKVNALLWQGWNNSRAKLEATSGGPVSEEQLLAELVGRFLGTPQANYAPQTNGAPARAPVNDSHFRVVVVHLAEVGATAALTAEGPVLLDPETAREILL